MYIHTVARPAVKNREREAEGRHRIQEARQRLFKRAYSIYKNEIQLRTLAERAEQRKGLVCANTRQAPKITRIRYDETARRGGRIAEQELYNMRRWARRDKCGPTLVDKLYHVWGIT